MRMTEVNMSASQVLDKMKKGGCRITKQRELIVDIIMNGSCTSCKEVYHHVIKKDAAIGMATVYRTIKQLEDMGVIRRIDIIEVNR